MSDLVLRATDPAEAALLPIVEQFLAIVRDGELTGELVVTMKLGRPTSLRVLAYTGARQGWRLPGSVARRNALR